MKRNPLTMSKIIGENTRKIYAPEGWAWRGRDTQPSPSLLTIIIEWNHSYQQNMVAGLQSKAGCSVCVGGVLYLNIKYTCLVVSLKDVCLFQLLFFKK